MPSRRSRSRSPERRRDRHRRDDSREDTKTRSSRRRDDSRDREEERDDDEKRTIKSLKDVGQREIDADDYFLKLAEFKVWLREEKGKYMDEISGEAATKYFKKFVKRWNNLVLPVQYYHPNSFTSAPAATQTAYKWSFASNRSKVDPKELDRLRDEVNRATHGVGSSSAGPSRPIAGPSLPSRSIGPTMPITTSFSASHTDRQLALEQQQEDLARERKAERNRAFTRADEMAPKSGGREGKMEERRATNAENRQYRERDMAGGLEVDEGTLMGGGNDFKQALARREAAAAKRQERRGQFDNDRRAGMSDRLQEMKAKDDQTMAMFRQMAQSKFGTGAG